MNHKHVKNLLALRLKKKKTDKGQIRLDRGGKTYQGHPGTDSGQAGTDQ